MSCCAGNRESDVLGLTRTSVLIPITRPERSISGPPELPGMIAVSAWIRLTSTWPFGAEQARRNQRIVLHDQDVTGVLAPC